jgi:3-hydroxyisobutyrate dehydrogenase
MTANDHDTNVVFTPMLRLKDVEYALRFARMTGLTTPFGELAGRQFRELIELGQGQVNESRIVDVARAQKVS